MKVNHYAVIPAIVRYDYSIADKAKLLFAEVSAASDAYGNCEEDNRFFAKSLRVDERSITRYISALVSAGHLSRVTEYGKRKLRLNPALIKSPDTIEDADDVPITDDISAFSLDLLAVWEKGLACDLEKKEMYLPYIQARLVRFTKEQLLSSVRNRITYVTKASEWHALPENRQYQMDIIILLRDDDSVFKYLNLKSEEDKPKLRAFGS